MNATLFLKRHASTILTFVGGAGVIATTVLAVKATPKALEKIDKAKEEKEEELTKLEIVKAAGTTYIPAMLVGASTIACIFGANILNQRNQVALMSAYALVDNSFKEYKKKLVELHGRETHQSVVDALAIEKAQDTQVCGSYMFGNCDLGADADGEPRLFYEEYSGRYFESTIEQVLQAEYHINRNYILRGYTVLNELYDFLGIEQTDYGDKLGWTPTDDGEYWIEFNHRKILIDEDLECYIIEMPWEPSAEFLEYYY